MVSPKYDLFFDLQLFLILSKRPDDIDLPYRVWYAPHTR